MVEMVGTQRSSWWQRRSANTAAAVTCLLVAACGAESTPPSPDGGGSDGGPADARRDSRTLPDSGQLNRCQPNRPSHLPLVEDYGFEDDRPATPAAGSGLASLPFGDSGWLGSFWDNGIEPGFRADVGDAPCSPSSVLEQVYPPDLFGDGPSGASLTLDPPLNEYYIAWVVKWDANFDHNEVSEKLLFLNLESGDPHLFQFEWNEEAIHYVAEAPEEGGNEALRANRAPNGAEPINGEWIVYELYFDVPTGTARWWRNGVLQGEHFGRDFGPLQSISINGTWGGGGYSTGTHSRYTDDILIAGQ